MRTTEPKSNVNSPLENTCKNVNQLRQVHRSHKSSCADNHQVAENPLILVNILSCTKQQDAGYSCEKRENIEENISYPSQSTIQQQNIVGE